MFAGPSFSADAVVGISCESGAGLGELRDLIAKRILGDVAASEGGLLTRERHRDAVERARRALSAAREALTAGVGLDCAAVDLGDALAALGDITGETTPDDVLHALFADFCVGK